MCVLWGVLRLKPEAKFMLNQECISQAQLLYIFVLRT